MSILRTRSTHEQLLHTTLVSHALASSLFKPCVEAQDCHYANECHVFDFSVPRRRRGIADFCIVGRAGLPGCGVLGRQWVCSTLSCLGLTIDYGQCFETKGVAYEVGCRSSCSQSNGQSLRSNAFFERRYLSSVSDMVMLYE